MPLLCCSVIRHAKYSDDTLFLANVIRPFWGERSADLALTEAQPDKPNVSRGPDPKSFS